MSDSVNDYISRLEQQLRLRGIVDPRILAEAREHLLDAVEDGRRRSLPVADAEHEALERFGPPEIVAAHILEERERMKTSIAGAFAAIWQRKWWILLPTFIAAVITSVTSYYFQPVRYQAHTTILVVPQRVPENYIRSSVTTKIEDRLRSINQQVRSRTRLERIIEDFNLYSERRKKDTMQDIVDDMSKAIHVEIIQGNVFRVAFTSDNPRTAQQVAERLAVFFVDESLKDGANLFLLKKADARLSASLERRQIGEQFRILDRARLPEQPVEPNRLRAAVLGALLGLAIGLALVVLRRSSNTRPPALAEA